MLVVANISRRQQPPNDSWQHHFSSFFSQIVERIPTILRQQRQRRMLCPKFRVRFVFVVDLITKRRRSFSFQVWRRPQWPDWILQDIAEDLDDLQIHIQEGVKGAWRIWDEALRHCRTARHPVSNQEFIKDMIIQTTGDELRIIMQRTGSYRYLFIALWSSVEIYQPTHLERAVRDKLFRLDKCKFGKSISSTYDGFKVL